MQKLDPNTDGKTMDIVADNIAKLKELFANGLKEQFPEIVTEGKVDFEALKEVLGEYVEDREERYSFTWNGKSKARMLAQTPSNGTLRPCPEESVDFDSTQNLFIEGDNLEVLKLMQKSYYAKIKMIYIDPPYNTGKDFVYKDNFKDNIRNYKEITGQVDGEGRNLSSNPETSGRYHTDWLNMMYPRLKLARNLLKDDGVIFISIDDNEASNVRKICDEIFGEENFVSQLVWEKKKKGAFLSGSVTNVKEYLFVFAKSKDSFPGLIGEIAKTEETYPVIKTTNARAERIIKKGIASKFREKDHHVPSGGRISSGNMEMILLSDLVIKDGTLVEDVKVDSNWIYSQELLDKYAEEKSLYITQDLYFRRIVTDPRTKMLKDLLPMRGSRETGFEFQYSDNLFADGWGTNEDGFDEIHELLGAQSLMSFPKPSKLIAKLCLSATRSDDNAIILDFFAGSATTAHAVMKLNKGDSGKRKFIMVQLPEATDKDTEAYQKGYKTISEVSKERIRRAAASINQELTMVSSENARKESLLEDSSFPSMAKKLDLGFKVFKLDSTNIKPWQADFDNYESSLDEYISNIKAGRSEEDVLYEILLKYGLDLTLPIETRIIADKKVFIVGLGALVLCLADGITLDVVEGIADLKEELKPEVMRVVFKDNGFSGPNGDVIKTNAIQILRQHGITDVKSL